MASKSALSIAQVFSAGQVDRASGIIYGVSVITVGAVEGHGVHADATTLRQVMKCAQTYAGGLKVKADHGSGIFSVAGYLRSFRIEGGQLKGDLYILASEENREKLFEMAEQIPDTFGLSISFSGPHETIKDRVYARCEEIYSADIVTEPAANPNGLFSALVDARPQGHMDKTEIQTMLTETLKPVTEGYSKFATDLADYGKRLAALEAKQTGKTESEGLAAGLATLKSELQTHFDSKTVELGKSIAAEFTKVVGTGPLVRADNPPAGVTSDPKLDVEFEKAVQAHFAKLNSKTKALSAAIKDNPKGYGAFMAAGRSISYQPKAA